MSTCVSLSGLFALSCVIRIFLVAYGEWQDRHFSVKFTDIDYHVFSDAAKYITQGESPYLRPTYRYTPLLAFVLTLNHYLFFSFGKIIFVVFDVATGWLIYKILSLRLVSEHLKLISCACWLLNPLTATVSSRGNAESLLSFLVLFFLYLIMCRHTISAAVVFGLSIHMKIFPIMYSLPLFLFIDAHYMHGDKEGRGWMGTMFLHLLPGKLASWLRPIFSQWLSRERMKFVASSCATFLLTTLVCYLWYGYDFIHEGYLYHVTRRDTRHNFSVYFYMLYLIQNSWLSLPVGILAFLPQAILLICSSVWLYLDIVFCCFVQTFTFVTFNKVCTSQYFLWYLCLVPLIIPSSKLKLWDVVVMTTLWFLGQALWLLPAYYLEFQGNNTFMFVWMASLLFFVINIYIVVKIIRNHQLVPMFMNGHITKSGHKLM